MKEDRMKLLISVTNLQEALRCVLAGVDIIDVKNPLEGSLGGHSPRFIKALRKIIPKRCVLSAAIGDVPNKPGMVSQAALGLSTCKVQYIKFGLCDSFSPRQATNLVKEVTGVVKNFSGKNIKVTVCGYADASLHGIIRPAYVPAIVEKAGADIAMIDTLDKFGNKGLFDYLTKKELLSFYREARGYGKEIALAGRLKTEDIAALKEYRLCDIIGIRSLACSQGKRNHSLQLSRIKGIKKLLSS